MSTGSVTSNTNSSSSASNSASNSVSNADPFAALDMSDFLKLMITEMQNQDPTAPEDTSEIMQQIGQMQSIQSTTELNTTLNALNLTQSLTSASQLINQNIAGIDDNGNNVNGTVSSVVVNNGAAALVVGNSTVQLSNIQQVL
jgi:flagellar basal-body rod modification protein FlgD